MYTVGLLHLNAEKRFPYIVIMLACRKTVKKDPLVYDHCFEEITL